LNPESFQPAHFRWEFADGVATVTLNRPERKNPLTFESYAELRDMFRELVFAAAVKAVVIAGAGGNFSSGGDVHEIIGPLTGMDMPGLLRFTRMTGDLVKAMRACPQPIVAARRAVPGVSTTSSPTMRWPRRRRSRAASPAARPSPTASPRPSSTANGR
jgi:1,4-dihydroxy-2-naphthoyl-CoA synthase